MIKDWVIEWFIKNSSIKQEELDLYEDRDYLKTGLIDSFGFLGLISSCEEELGVLFTDDDFTNNDIFTINGLVKIISDKKAV